MPLDLTNHMPCSVEHKMSWGSWMKLDELIVLCVTVNYVLLYFASKTMQQLAWRSASR